MSPVVIGILLALLAFVCALLTSWARAADNLMMRWPGAIVAGLLTLACAAGGIGNLFGAYRLDWPRGNPVTERQVAMTADQVARGERLAHLCVGCHSTTGRMPLDGGQTNLIGDSAGGGLGILYAPNLTPGGPIKDWSDGEIIRAIREGIGRDGRALIVMPSEGFRSMSDADVEAIVAYLRSQPAVERVTPPRAIGPVGTILIGMGIFPTAAQPPISGSVVAPSAGPFAAYGGYLVDISGCRSCHGADLTGGQGVGGRSAPNLTGLVPQWSKDDFIKTMRTGSDPTGHVIDPGAMPWREISAAFSDEELEAIYIYLHNQRPAERSR